jgi:hypothetical protein
MASAAAVKNLGFGGLAANVDGSRQTWVAIATLGT